MVEAKNNNRTEVDPQEVILEEVKLTVKKVRFPLNFFERFLTSLNEEELDEYAKNHPDTSFE